MKKTLFDKIADLKDCDVKVKMINRITGAVIHNKGYSSFLGDLKRGILDQWDIIEIVVVPKEAALTVTEITEESDAEEALFDDSGVSG